MHRDDVAAAERDDYRGSLPDGTSSVASAVAIIRGLFTYNGITSIMRWARLGPGTIAKHIDCAIQGAMGLGMPAQTAEAINTLAKIHRFDRHEDAALGS